MTFNVAPGESIQDTVDQALAGDTIVLQPGLHEVGLTRSNAGVLIDKPLNLELKAGATVRSKSGIAPMQPPEVVTDHSAAYPPIYPGDIQVTYPALPDRPVAYMIKITGTTFRWAKGLNPNPTTWGGIDIPITRNAPILLADGISVTFTRQPPSGGIYYVTFDQLAYSTIRVGAGRQAKPIDGVNIYGAGTIDGNLSGNLGNPTGMAAEIPACLMFRGRVTNVKVSGVTIQNCHRAVMVLAEHSGIYLDGGATSGGESFDASGFVFENLTITQSFAAFLIGHPEFRGYVSDVTIRNNLITTAWIAIEPNFRFSNFLIEGNRIDAGRFAPEAIHCWRGPWNGTIRNNVRTNSGGNGFLLISTLSGWPVSYGIVTDNNLTEG